MVELLMPRRRDLYTVRDNGQYFRTGQTASNDQVLFGVLAGEDGLEVAAVWFDPAGRFSRFSTRQVTVRPAESEEAAVRRELADFQRACGYRPDAIHVEQFSVPDRFIRIEDIPEHYQDFLSNQDDYDADRQEELAADIKKWVQDGDYVLWWGEDYYLDSKGEVVSS